MIINIDKNYLIESDKFNWILKKRRKTPVKTGDKISYFREIGYFVSLESAVQNLANLKIRLIPDYDINIILNKIQKISIDLQKALRPYEIGVV